jgi:hypothetical protein
MRRAPRWRHLVKPAASLVFLSRATRTGIITADLFRRARGRSRIDTLHWLVIGKPPFIERDDPTGDIFGGRRIEGIKVLSWQVSIAAADVGERHHSAHGGRRIG